MFKNIFDCFKTKTFTVYHCNVGYAYQEWDDFKKVIELEKGIKVQLIDVVKFDYNDFKFIYKEEKI